MFPGATDTPEMLVAIQLKLTAMCKDPKAGLNVRTSDLRPLVVRAAALVTIPDIHEVEAAQMLASRTAQRARRLTRSRPGLFTSIIQFFTPDADLPHYGDGPLRGLVAE